jgi:hypothetical protein
MPFSLHIILDSAVSAVAKIASNDGGGFTRQEAQELVSNIVTLMGMSFVLGVLFTTFILLVLDFVRRNKTSEE